MLITEKQYNTGKQISKAGLDWVEPQLYFSLAPRTIQSDNASIKRRIVNECGA